MVGRQQPGRAGDEGRVERFRPTSGRFTGIVLVVGALSLAVLSVVDDDAVIPEVGVAALFVAVLGWVVTLRPRVSLVGDDLELRGMLDSVAIPLAAVEELAVRQVLAVRAGDRRFTSPALGRSLRSLVKANRPSEVPDDAGPAKVWSESYPEYVEERIRQRVDDAVARAGIRRGSDDQVALACGVRRRAAWPEIIALVGTAVATVLVLAL
jgi:hypothetical protein